MYFFSALKGPSVCARVTRMFMGNGTQCQTWGPRYGMGVREEREEGPSVKERSPQNGHGGGRGLLGLAHKAYLEGALFGGGGRGEVDSLGMLRAREGERRKK